MAYRFEITTAALKAAKKLPLNVRRAIIRKSQVLKKDPLAGQKLRGKYRFLRSFHLSFKGTEYRVIYEVDKKEQKIYIRYANSRENLYRDLEKMRLRSLTN